MTALYAIMRDYFTIIRDYFTDYFTDYFAIILRLLRLFYRLYAIISRRRHLENGNVQKAILDPITEEGLVSVYEECCLRTCIDWKAHRQNGNLPDGEYLHYYTHYFSIIRIICLG